MRTEDIPLYRALKGERFTDIEMVIISKAGEKRSLLASGQPIKDAKVNIHGAVVAMYEITERKKVEESIKENDRKYRDIFHNSLVSLWEEDISVPTKKAIPLGLIINELATDAIKYGFNMKEKAKSSIDLKENKSGTVSTLTVSNTGNSFPRDIDLDNPQTLGFRLVLTPVQQLEVSIELEKGLIRNSILRFHFVKSSVHH